MNNKVLIIFSQIVVNEELQIKTGNLISYITEESWQYCDRYKIVEPNKILPNYEKQKMKHINNCVCEKGRYFVPMVCYIYLLVIGFYFID